jgi:AraC-like DNA-binding protein
MVWFLMLTKSTISHALQKTTAGITKSKITSYPSNLRQTWHKDTVSKISIVLDGTLSEETSRSSVVATPLDIVIKSTNVEHENRYGHEGATLFSLEVDSNWLSFGPSPSEQTEWSWIQGRHSCRQAMLIFEAFLSKDSDALNSSIIETIAWATADSFEIKKKQSIRRELQLLREQVLDTANPTIDVVAVAQEIGLHPVYLTRAYKETFGLSIQEDRQLRRIKRGVELLVTTNETIADVALGLNFFDQSHFSRTFRRYVGTTPAKYRSQLAALTA